MAPASGRSGAIPWGPTTSSRRARDGRTFRMPNVVDAITRAGLAIRVARKLRGVDVMAGFVAHLKRTSAAG